MSSPIFLFSIEFDRCDGKDSIVVNCYDAALSLLKQEKKCDDVDLLNHQGTLLLLLLWLDSQHVIDKSSIPLRGAEKQISN